MAAHRYEKWSVHGLRNDGGESAGVEVHDHADGTEYRVWLDYDDEDEPVVSSLTITPGPAAGGIDRRRLRAVPIGWLRKFADDHVRRSRNSPGVIELDLRHFETDDGVTLSPDDEQKLRAFAELYVKLGPRPQATNGPRIARRAWLANDPASPYENYSESWIDKTTRKAREYIEEMTVDNGEDDDR